MSRTMSKKQHFKTTTRNHEFQSVWDLQILRLGIKLCNTWCMSVWALTQNGNGVQTMGTLKTKVPFTCSTWLRPSSGYSEKRCVHISAQWESYSGTWWSGRHHVWTRVTSMVLPHQMSDKFSWWHCTAMYHLLSDALFLFSLPVFSEIY